MRSFQRWAVAVLMIGLIVPVQGLSVAGAAGGGAKRSCQAESRVKQVSRLWTKIALPDPGGPNDPRFLATDPSRPGQLFYAISAEPLNAVGYDRVYGSKDDGCTWELILETPDLPTANQPVARESHSIGAMGAGPGTLYAVLAVRSVLPGVTGVPSGYLAVTRDLGATWEYRPLPVGEWDRVEELHISQADPDTVYLLARPKVTQSIPVPREGMRLFRSSDAGGSWQEVGRSPSACSVAVDPLDPEVVWVWDDKSSFCINANPVTRSLNGGGVWQEVSVQMSQAEALATFRRPHQPASVLVIGTFGSGNDIAEVALFSKDGGLSWTNMGWDAVPNTFVIFGRSPDEMIGHRLDPRPDVVEGLLRYDKRFDGWISIQPPGIDVTAGIHYPQMVETSRRSTFYFLILAEGHRGIWRYAR